MNSQAMDQPRALLRLLTFCSGQLLVLKKSPPNAAAHYHNDFGMLTAPINQEFGRWQSGMAYPCSVMSGVFHGKTRRVERDSNGWDLESSGGFFTFWPCESQTSYT